MRCAGWPGSYSLSRHLLQEAKLELKKSKRKDYYKILAVDKTANEEEIKKAYRKRAMTHHPDRHAGATEVEKKDHEMKFKEVGVLSRPLLTPVQVGEAYAILSDEKKRRMYDSGQDIEDGGGGGGYHDVDPNSIFQVVDPPLLYHPSSSIPTPSPPAGVLRGRGDGRPSGDGRGRGRGRRPPLPPPGDGRGGRRRRPELLLPVRIEGGRADSLLILSSTGRRHSVI